MGVSVRTSPSPLRSARVPAGRVAVRSSLQRDTHHDISSPTKQPAEIVPHSTHSMYTSTHSMYTSAHSSSDTAAEPTQRSAWSPFDLHVPALTAAVAIGLLEAAAARPGVAAEAALEGAVSYHAQLVWQVRYPLNRTLTRSFTKGCMFALPVVATEATLECCTVHSSCDASTGSDIHSQSYLKPHVCPPWNDSR